MPRTKAVRAKKKDSFKATKGELLIRQNIRDQAIQEFKQELAILEDRKNDCVFKLNMVKNQIPHKYANRTIAELKASITISSGSEVLIGESLLETTGNKKRTQPQSRLKRSLSFTEDEAGSIESKTKSRTSRSRSRAPPPKSTRVSRSLSRSKLQHHQPLNTYRTPAQRGNAPQTFGVITPKVKPNTPQVILRRPQQGEVALSLQGSPLMVNSVVSDQIANVNIPLPDGRLLSLQPERGLRLSQFPPLSPNTQKQIQALRDNLNKVCAYVNTKRK